MNLDILFLGRLFPREMEAEIKRKMKTGMQDAANALQWNIIDGFEANECGNLKILNYLPVDSFPKGYIDKKIEEFIFQHTDKYQADDLNVGCTNISGVKQFLNIIPFKKHVKKWSTKDNGMKKVLISYTANPMFLKLAQYTKKYNKNIETCCIIADIPEFSTARDLGGIRKIYNNYTVRRCANLFNYIDKFVLLTKQMAKKLDIKVPFIVMEGIATNIDNTFDNRISDKFKYEKYVLYSGTLNYKFGIKILLDAFSRIEDKDIKLVICGFGEAEQLVKERQKEDNRIIFLGKLDRKEVISLQRYANVLVNPRQNNEEFTKYSFPSKNLEYLSSGVPVVAYKLDGIPDEYDDYFFYPHDDTPKALAEKIEKIYFMQDNVRIQIGETARQFVIKNKNNFQQTKRILHFINSNIY